MRRARCRGHLVLRDAALCAALRVRWSESRAWLLSSDRLSNSPPVFGQASPPLFFTARGRRSFFIPRSLIEGDGAPRSATSRFPMPPRDDTGARLRASGDTRALRRSIIAAISLPGTVLPGRGQTAFDPCEIEASLVPAGFGPHSSYPVQPLRAAPLSWGGRQTQGVPDARVRTVRAGAAIPAPPSRRL